MLPRAGGRCAVSSLSIPQTGHAVPSPLSPASQTPVVWILKRQRRKTREERNAPSEGLTRNIRRGAPKLSQDHPTPSAVAAQWKNSEKSYKKPTSPELLHMKKTETFNLFYYPIAACCCTVFSLGCGTQTSKLHL